jgi:hypothetical protein
MESLLHNLGDRRGAVGCVVHAVLGRPAVRHMSSILHEIQYKYRVDQRCASAQLECSGSVNTAMWEEAQRRVADATTLRALPCCFRRPLADWLVEGLT